MRNLSVGAAAPASVTNTLAAKSLGVDGVLSTAGAAIAPAVVVAGVITTGYAVTGVTGFPVALLVVALILAIWVPGYIAMSQRVRNAGAFYTYIARGLGRPAGVAASFVAVPAYMAMAVATFGALGPVGSAILTEFGLSVPWWQVALGAWLLIAILGALRISISGRVLGVALLAELVVVLVADVVNLTHPYRGSVSFDAWDPATLSGQWGVALAIAGTAFVGFEAAGVFSEESRGRNTVAVATSLALGAAFVLYALSGWAMAVTVGSANLQRDAGEYGPDLPFATAATHLGTDLIIDLGRLLLATSLLAAALAYHNTVARYTYALGREGVLPRVLGRVNPRSGAPVSASLLQTALGFVVIGVFAVTGADPLVRLFYWGGAIGGLGVLILIAATSISIIGFLRRNPRGLSPLVRLVLPAVAALLLAIVIGLILDNLDALLGVTPDSPLRWLLPAAFALLAMLGLAWAGFLHRYRPAAYRAIGLGSEQHLPTNRNSAVRSYR